MAALALGIPPAAQAFATGESPLVAIVHFEDGKISAKSKQYYNEQMTKVIAANRPQPISADMINRLPSSDVVAVFASNFAPENIIGMLKLLGVDVMANAFLVSKFNPSLRQFLRDDPFRDASRTDPHPFPALRGSDGQD